MVIYAQISHSEPHFYYFQRLIKSNTNSQGFFFIATYSFYLSQTRILYYITSLHYFITKGTNFYPNTFIHTTADTYPMTITVFLPKIRRP